VPGPPIQKAIEPSDVTTEKTPSLSVEEERTNNSVGVDTNIDKGLPLNENINEAVAESTEVKTIEIQHFLGEVVTSNSSTVPAQLVEFQSFSSVPLMSTSSSSVRRRGKELRIDEQVKISNEVPTLDDVDHLDKVEIKASDVQIFEVEGHLRGEEFSLDGVEGDNEVPILEDVDHVDEGETKALTNEVPILEVRNYSSIEILENSVKLLKKLIMISASNLGVEELPAYLQHVLKTNFSSSSLAMKPYSTQKPENISKGRKNFRHKKFSRYYKDLQRKEILRSQVKVNNDQELKTDLISSLRSQLTRSALKDEKLKAKANRVPVYQPRRKINKTMLSQLYRRKNKDSNILGKVMQQEGLDSELQDTLKAQLARLEKDLALKNVEEEVFKEEELEVELSDSLRNQFSSVLRNLSPPTTTLRPQVVVERPVTKEELTEALEEQLNSLFQRDDNRT